MLPPAPLCADFATASLHPGYCVTALQRRRTRISKIKLGLGGAFGSDDALADGFIVPVTCGALPSLETSEASWYEQPETAMNDRMAAMGFIAIGRARQSHRHRRGAAVPLSLYKCRRHHSTVPHEHFGYPERCPTRRL
jgi:hypothetical protein